MTLEPIPPAPMPFQTSRPSASQGENTAGVIGFVISLVSLVTCGLLAPLGLLISLFAMFKPPRGMATAGLIINLLGCVLLAAVGLAVIGGAFAFMKTGEVINDAVKGVATIAAIESVVQSVESYKVTHDGKLPETDEGPQIVAGQQDGWQRELRYIRIDDQTFEVSSAGQDGQFGNIDDLTQKDIPKPGERGDLDFD